MSLNMNDISISSIYLVDCSLFDARKRKKKRIRVKWVKSKDADDMNWNEKSEWIARFMCLFTPKKNKGKIFVMLLLWRQQICCFFASQKIWEWKFQDQILMKTSFCIFLGFVERVLSLKCLMNVNSSLDDVYFNLTSVRYQLRYF